MAPPPLTPIKLSSLQRKGAKSPRITKEFRADSLVPTYAEWARTLELECDMST